MIRVKIYFIFLSFDFYYPENRLDQLAISARHKHYSIAHHPLFFPFS